MDAGDGRQERGWRGYGGRRESGRGNGDRRTKEGAKGSRERWNASGKRRSGAGGGRDEPLRRSMFASLGIRAAAHASRRSPGLARRRAIPAWRCPAPRCRPALPHAARLRSARSTLPGPAPRAAARAGPGRRHRPRRATRGAGRRRAALTAPDPLPPPTQPGPARPGPAHRCPPRQPGCPACAPVPPEGRPPGARAAAGTPRDQALSARGSQRASCGGR